MDNHGIDIIVLLLNKKIIKGNIQFLIMMEIMIQILLYIMK